MSSLISTAGKYQVVNKASGYVYCTERIYSKAVKKLKYYLDFGLSVKIQTS